MKPLIDVFNRISTFVNNAMPVDRRVRYSIKKYGQTYRLLETFDEKHLRDPKKLADPGRLRPYIQKLQKGARKPG